MKTIKVIKLGTRTYEKATGANGTLTHWYMDMEGHVDYLFQPKGLDKDGQPVKAIIVVPIRLHLADTDFEEIVIPFEILGSIVTDKTSGFSGMAVGFVRHINGCFHVSIQPKCMERDPRPVRQREFDLRECEGEKIPQLTEEEQNRSKAKNPSPMEAHFDHVLGSLT